MKTTNYLDSFIAVSPDCPAATGEVPVKRGTVAALQLELLQIQPYGLTSDDLLFEVHVRRHGIADADRAAGRTALFSKSQACLRASPLVKKHGWGLHHDGQGRVAAYGIGTDAYLELSARKDLKQIMGMRSAR